MKEDRTNAYHTTERELEFIDKLGTFNEDGIKISLVDLLRGYLKGIEKRKIWTGLDKKRILLRATRRLEREVNLSLSII